MIIERLIIAMTQQSKILKADIQVTTIDTRRRDGLNLLENTSIISSLFFHQLERLILARNVKIG
jgi:hypothetical protein